MARVLICDDDPAICRLFETVLSRSKFEVIATTSSADCLRICRQILPDLAIVDLVMPVTSGVELIKHLREEFPVLTILVVSCAPSDQLNDAWTAGANMVIRKPVPPALLVSTVRRLVKSSPSTEQFDSKLRCTHLASSNILSGWCL